MDSQKLQYKFGICEPYLQDIKLLPLYKQYIKSESYKNIQREYIKYKKEKWDYMITFYEPDMICKFLEDATCNFLEKWHKEQRKRYVERNKDKLKEQQHAYYENNKEVINKKKIEYNKKYKETHKEEVKIKNYNQNKKYRETHKEELNTKLREKVTCECGAIVSKGFLWRHKKTNAHIFKL